MSAPNVVIVESPAKARTINKYLGRDFEVVPSFGHVRDLPAKDGSVRPEEDFAMDWTADGRASRQIREIVDKVRGAKRLYLATDPDREGEAISWHVREVLAEKGLLSQLEIERIAFHEITKSAVQEALARPRGLDDSLIEAYLARRALDYLVGFTLSPVLWRKLPGSKSAGRVQSVALRLICEREAEIEAFQPQEYWSLTTDMATPRDEAFQARLHTLDGEKLDRLAIGAATRARDIARRIEQAAFTVGELARKEVRRKPAPPFITSTLQQEASRRLGFSATRTMRTAQRLYEGVEIDGESTGLITYMRTDSVSLSGEAIAGARALIETDYGKGYLPASPRAYKSKAKNAQEAHEAIRPTEFRHRPQALRGQIGEDEFKLYELIWRRAVACQMENAVLDQTTADLVSQDGAIGLRASGQVQKFDGFLKLYQEARSEDAEAEDSRRLPELAEGEPVETRAVTPAQHFTQPPPRYTEATLVRSLEELGIGRPSTYASIIQVLQDRDYVRLEKKRFIPEDRGRIVTAFLTHFFKRYVEYGFTADLEERLDRISAGEMDWKQVLRDFWGDFHAAVEQTGELRIAEVIDALDAELGDHFFPAPGDDTDPRSCPACGDGRLGLRLGKLGAFIGCSNYPDCRYTRPLAPPGDEAEAAAEAQFPRALGDEPETGLPVSLCKGPYGLYIQLGPPRAPATESAADETADKSEDKSKSKSKTKTKSKSKADKPKRVSLPARLDPDSLDLDLALKLLALPREVGTHPETGATIQAGIGRYGPYLRHQGAYVSLPDDDTVLGIGLDHAVTLIAEKAKARGKGGGPQPLRELGAHPEDGKPVTLHSGRYGPYVKHGRTNASLGKGDDPDSLDLDRAVALIAARQQKSGGKSGGGTGGGGKSGGAKTRSKSQNKSKSKGKAGGSAQSKSRSTSSA